jgi:hypothetical protein
MTARLIKGAFGAVLLAAAVSAAAPALAQDASQDPVFGSLTLKAGFQPDPRNVDIVAGGTEDASHLGGACVGMVGSPPDFRLDYTAGGLPLNLWVYADVDTTLVVNDPSGAWVCNDDGAGDGGNVNPGLRWANPPSGVYDIWIGRYASGDGANAKLVITETH